MVWRRTLFLCHSRNASCSPGFTHFYIEPPYKLPPAWAYHITLREITRSVQHLYTNAINNTPRDIAWQANVFTHLIDTTILSYFSKKAEGKYVMDLWIYAYRNHAPVMTSTARPADRVSRYANKGYPVFNSKLLIMNYTLSICHN